MPKHLARLDQRLDWIDPNALKIVETLQRRGFETYLVGGCVRDILVGIHPKDFDIATSARPEQVRRSVPNAYVIGRRFRLVLVKRGDQQFEVATFRRNELTEDTSEDVIANEEVTANPLSEEAKDEILFGETRPPQDSAISTAPEPKSSFVDDNVFGTSEEDALRRDFSVNGLFYDPQTSKIIDHCSGLKDIEDCYIRMIGDPLLRLVEDPIRILRAVRLAHKLEFTLTPDLRSAIQQTASELKRSVLPRRREEFLKFLRLPHPERAFTELYDLGVLAHIAPRLHELYEYPDRREIFFANLGRLHQGKIDLTSPLELYCAFVYSFIKSLHETTGRDALTLLDAPETVELMRNELGIFKLESANLARSIQLIEQLHKTDSYQRKGFRRQSALMANEAFGLALKVAQIDYSVFGSKLVFWLREFEEKNRRSR